MVSARGGRVGMLIARRGGGKEGIWYRTVGTGTYNVTLRGLVPEMSAARKKLAIGIPPKASRRLENSRLRVRHAQSVVRQ